MAHYCIISPITPSRDDLIDLYSWGNVNSIYWDDDITEEEYNNTLDFDCKEVTEEEFYKHQKKTGYPIEDWIPKN